MNKRIRSRVLAAGVASSAILGLGAFPFLQQASFAQDKPPAAEQLDRGSRLFDQKQYAEAKKVLLDIDPGQLPEDQRGKLTELLKNTDVELAKSQGANAGFDTAQASLDGDKLAAAATGFQGVIDDPTASSDLKDKAKIQLALVKEKQTAKAPQMKELLTQAQSLYDAGKLDESQDAVNTVIASGADLGWQDNAKPAQLQQKIADRRAALGSTTAAAGPMAMATSAPPAADTMASPAPATTDAAATPMATSAPASDTTPTTPSNASTPPMAADATPAIAPAAPAPAGVDPNSALGQTISADEIERQRALTLYNIALKDSSDAMAANPPQYAVAVERAHEAGAIIDDNRRYFSDVEANALRGSATRQEQLATANKGAYDAQATAREQALALQAEKDLATKRKAEKGRRIDALMRDAQRFVDTQQYKEGADTLRQVLIIDPTNASAKLMLSLVNDRIAYRQYEQVIKQGSRENMKTQIQNAEELVPYADLLVYPENWVDITRTRLGDQSEQDSVANRTARARLAENLKEITADQLGLERVINFLRDNTGTNIFVNWKALEAAGIDRNTPVSVNLHDAPFSKVLTTVLASVGGTANLSYTVDDGVITISTKDDLTSTVPPRIATYDIRDLLIQPDNKAAPNLDVQQSTSQAGSSGGGSSSIFGANADNTTVTPQAARDDIVKKITDAIKSTVAPDSWRDSGGSIGTIQEISGQLLINQTVDNHVAIENLLDKIRETHAVQIAIEARIMFVNSNFFEQFGFSWNLALSPGELGSSVGGVSVGSNTLTTTNNLSTGILGGTPNFLATTPSLSLSGSILDNFQLNLLIQATQADVRTINVSSPRITLFNGQQGFIQVIRETGYISNFNQTITPGTINSGSITATTLTTSLLQTGVVLGVEAAVSADRRYVIMQVTPQLSTNDGFQNIGSLNSTTNNNTFAGIFLQLPNVDVTAVHTTVSVPDGGTLLLGGEKVVSTVDVEVGVPILSKIPGINRLFTNRSTEKDERTLLVLVRPKIIIQKEIENNLYGPGYDRPTGLPTNGTAQSVLDGNGIDPTFKAMGR